MGRSNSMTGTSSLTHYLRSRSPSHVNHLKNFILFIQEINMNIKHLDQPQNESREESNAHWKAIPNGSIAKRCSGHIRLCRMGGPLKRIILSLVHSEHSPSLIEYSLYFNKLYSLIIFFIPFCIQIIYKIMNLFHQVQLF